MHIPDSINMLFPLLKFDNEEEKQQFNEYMVTRGIYLYKYVYDTLRKWEPNVQEIKYVHFKNIIRYDKRLRDKLYVFLAAAEEYLRNIIFENIDIKLESISKKRSKIDVSKLFPRDKDNRSADSNLYYYSYEVGLYFGAIEKVFRKFHLAEQNDLKQSDITKVVELRNKVMHHNMLLLSKFSDRTSIEKEISKVEKEIEALYRILTTKELKNGTSIDGKEKGGLSYEINKCNYKDGDITRKPYDNLISLHAFKNGRFLRQ